jgi:hypothetical protein
MKISGPSGTSQAGPAKAARPAAGGGGFSIASSPAPVAAAPTASVASTGHVMGVEALIALQDVGSPLERRRRSVARAGRLLDVLDGIKVALVGGDLTGADLDKLSRALREQRADTEDPKLEGLLDEIETRAAVEMAKLETAARAA